MTSGIATARDTELTEPWRAREEKNVLAAAEKRIRGRISELYDLSERDSNRDDCRRLVRKALTEAEGLCELAAGVLRRDWLAS